MSAHEALRWAQAARATYERELSRVGITGLHKAAIGDVLEGVRHVEALAALGAARVEGPPLESFEQIAQEVHAAWRDGMLADGRPVASERMTWDALAERDKMLDRYIAARVYRLVYSAARAGSPPPGETHRHLCNQPAFHPGPCTCDCGAASKRGEQFAVMSTSERGPHAALEALARKWEAATRGPVLHDSEFAARDALRVCAAQLRALLTSWRTSREERQREGPSLRLSGMTDEDWAMLAAMDAPQLRATLQQLAIAQANGDA